MTFRFWDVGPITATAMTTGKRMAFAPPFFIKYQRRTWHILRGEKNLIESNNNQVYAIDIEYVFLDTIVLAA